MTVLQKALFAYYMLLALIGYIGVPIMLSGYLLVCGYGCWSAWQLVYGFGYTLGGLIFLYLTCLSYPGVYDGATNAKRNVFGERE